ncbi:MAG: hypothetical protein LBK73_05090 [Treponema sp.]|nr:hypothetical protein [Treponema sp.]
MSGWMRAEKMKRYWRVQVEVYEDGAVKAAVLGSRKAEAMPRDGHVENPRREVFSLWYESEVTAQGAVLEALAMNKKQEAAA